MRAYDFKNMRKDFALPILALIFNQEDMTERIIIGNEEDVWGLINGGNNEVYYDKTHPLGTLLFSFGNDNNIGEWKNYAFVLQESYNIIRSKRAKTTKPVSVFLEEKFKSEEPTSIFAAVYTWDYYSRCYSMNFATEELEKRLTLLYKSFEVCQNYKPWQNEDISTFLNVSNNCWDFQKEVWAKTSKRPFETAVVRHSFLPIFSYYEEKITAWKLKFKNCEVCGSLFLTKNSNNKMCSKKCSDKRNVETQHNYKEKQKLKKEEKARKNVNNCWDRLNRELKNNENVNPQDVPFFEKAKTDFKKESCERKRLVKNGSLTSYEYIEWLNKKHEEAYELFEKTIKSERTV